MKGILRSVAYMGKSQKEIDSWAKDVSDIVNTNLQALQSSLASSFNELPEWSNQGKVTEKPLKGDQKGSHQLTIKHKDSYRVVYVASYEDKIFVLHAFKKKTEGVSKPDMETVAQRLKILEQARKNGEV